MIHTKREKEAVKTVTIGSLPVGTAFTYKCSDGETINGIVCGIANFVSVLKFPLGSFETAYRVKLGKDKLVKLADIELTFKV